MTSLTGLSCAGAGRGHQWPRLLGAVWMFRRYGRAGSPQARERAEALEEEEQRHAERDVRRREVGRRHDTSDGTSRRG